MNSAFDYLLLLHEIQYEDWSFYNINMCSQNDRTMDVFFIIIIYLYRKYRSRYLSCKCVSRYF